MTAWDKESLIMDALVIGRQVKELLIDKVYTQQQIKKKK